MGKEQTLQKQFLGNGIITLKIRKLICKKIPEGPEVGLERWKEKEREEKRTHT